VSFLFGLFEGLGVFGGGFFEVVFGDVHPSMMPYGLANIHMPTRVDMPTRVGIWWCHTTTEHHHGGKNGAHHQHPGQGQPPRPPSTPQGPGRPTKSRPRRPPRRTP